MKKKILIMLAAIMLLTAFASCGSVTEEDVLGDWVLTYKESPGGERAEIPSDDDYFMEYVTITRGKLETLNVSKTYGSFTTTVNWELSSSGKMTTTRLSGEKLSDVYYYKNGELSLELSDGSKRIYTRK